MGGGERDREQGAPPSAPSKASLDGSRRSGPERRHSLTRLSRATRSAKRKLRRSPIILGGCTFGEQERRQKKSFRGAELGFWALRNRGSPWSRRVRAAGPPFRRRRLLSDRELLCLGWESASGVGSLRLPLSLSLSFLVWEAELLSVRISSRQPGRLLYARGARDPPIG